MPPCGRGVARGEGEIRWMPRDRVSGFPTRSRPGNREAAFPATRGDRMLARFRLPPQRVVAGDETFEGSCRCPAFAIQSSRMSPGFLPAHTALRQFIPQARDRVIAHRDSGATRQPDAFVQSGPWMPDSEPSFSKSHVAGIDPHYEPYHSSRTEAYSLPGSASLFWGSYSDPQTANSAISMPPAPK